MEHHPLGLAARYNDSDAEEVGLEATIAKHGLELADVMYLAEQRALRAVMFGSGRLGEFRRAYATNRPAAIALSAAERAMVEMLKIAYLDAILIGWRGHQIQTRIDAEGNDTG